MYSASGWPCAAGDRRLSAASASARRPACRSRATCCKMPRSAGANRFKMPAKAARRRAPPQVRQFAASNPLASSAASAAGFVRPHRRHSPPAAPIARPGPGRRRRPYPWPTPWPAPVAPAHSRDWPPQPPARRHRRIRLAAFPWPPSRPAWFRQSPNRDRQAAANRCVPPENRRPDRRPPRHRARAAGTEATRRRHGTAPAATAQHCFIIMRPS